MSYLIMSWTFKIFVLLAELIEFLFFYYVVKGLQNSSERILSGFQKLKNLFMALLKLIIMDKLILFYLREKFLN